MYLHLRILAVPAARIRRQLRPNEYRSPDQTDLGNESTRIHITIVEPVPSTATEQHQAKDRQYFSSTALTEK